MPQVLLHPKLFSAPLRAATRDGFGQALLELGRSNRDVVVLTADLAESTRVDKFAVEFPDRFIQVGVAEQNLVGVAAGLALSGKIPFATSFGVFVPGRCWDQIRVSVCYSNANVKLVGSHAGLSVGPDGATHQALEDVAALRAIPNLTIIAPCDAEETRKATLAAAKMKGPVYLRLTRPATPIITTKSAPFKIGRHTIVRPGSDVTICASGPLLYQALVAARQLQTENIKAEVINCATLKPFDDATLTKSVKKTRCCVTVEDHQIIGGLFGAVTETLARHFPCPVEPIGMPDHFGESGEPEELYEKYGMTVKDIVAATKKVIARI